MHAKLQHVPVEHLQYTQDTSRETDAGCQHMHWKLHCCSWELHGTACQAAACPCGAPAGR